MLNMHRAAFSRSRACVAILIAMQENEFGHSAELINAYLAAAF
jgi:hypothetical protein